MKKNSSILKSSEENLKNLRTNRSTHAKNVEKRLSKSDNCGAYTEEAWEYINESEEKDYAEIDSIWNR